MKSARAPHAVRALRDTLLDAATLRDTLLPKLLSGELSVNSPIKAK